MRSRSFPHVVAISATSFIGGGTAAFASAADTGRGTAEAEPATECPLPISAAAAEAEDPDAPEATEPTSDLGTTDVAEDATPAEGFFAGFCARAQQVAAIGPLLTGSPTRENSEKFREGLCGPEFEAPDRDQATQNWVIYISGTSQTDPDSGATWLEAGVLTSYEEGDSDATELDEDIVEQLVDAEMAFLEHFEEHYDEWCADLIETVETTES